MKIIVYLFSAISFTLVLIHHVSAQDSNKVVNKQAKKLDIQIHSADSTIKINDNILKTYELDYIEKILGKPDRIMTDTLKTYYGEFGKNGAPPKIIHITIINYYYIYDKMGIMFFTDNIFSNQKEPNKLSIYFRNKRLFTNAKTIPFSPHHSFNGVFKINSDTVNVDKKIIPENVNYLIEEFKLFGMSFSSTSTATIIDKLYSKNAKPNILIFLDSEKNQRISYIELY